MSYEIEIKFRVSDRSALAARLMEIGAKPGPTRIEADLYFAHPSRDFKASDEVLRLRRIDDCNRITYKGPKQPGPAKTRREIEVPFAEGGASRTELTEVLENLGFTKVLEVVKQRTSYTLDRAENENALTITIDELDGLGTFAEVEMIVNSDSEFPAAQQSVRAFAGRLGLLDIEPSSYLGLALAAGQRLPGPARTEPGSAGLGPTDTV